MSTIKPWRAKQFATGYSAEYLPAGQRSWRIVKSAGNVVVFRSMREAIAGAENAYLRLLEPTIRATLPVNPDRLSAKLSDEAENWLRSKREDVQKRETLHRPGKKPLIVLPGRVRA